MNEQPNDSEGQESNKGTENSTAQNQTTDTTTQSSATGEQNANSNSTQPPAEDLAAIDWYNKTHAGGKAELTVDNATGIKQAKMMLEREKLLSEKDKEISQLKTSSSTQTTATVASSAPAQPQANTSNQTDTQTSALPPEVAKQLENLTNQVGEVLAGKKVDTFITEYPDAKEHIDKIAEIAKESTGGDLQNAYYIFRGRTGTSSNNTAAPTGGVGGVGTQSSSASTIATGNTMTRKEFYVQGKKMLPKEFNELEKQIAEGKVKLVD